MRGLRLDLIKPGRVLFSMSIPSRLLNSGKVDVIQFPPLDFRGSRAYVNEEIEIDARVLRAGQGMAVVSVEFRKKKTGQIFAQGRHNKYIPFISKM